MIIFIQLHFSSLLFWTKMIFNGKSHNTCKWSYNYKHFNVYSWLVACIEISFLKSSANNVALPIHFPAGCWHRSVGSHFLCIYRYNEYPYKYILCAPQNTAVNPELFFQKQLKQLFYMNAKPLRSAVRVGDFWFHLAANGGSSWSCALNRIYWNECTCMCKVSLEASFTQPCRGTKYQWKYTTEEKKKHLMISEVNNVFEDHRNIFEKYVSVCF